MSLSQDGTLPATSGGSQPVSDDIYLFPTSFQQRRIWFLEQLQSCGSTYALPVVLRVSGRLESAALEEALNAILRRHEVLRTTFAVRDGEPVQVIWPELRVPLEEEAVPGEPGPGREARALEAVAEQARRPFDLARGPLFRAHLWRLAPDDHILLVNMHHTVADGWSFRVLLEELGALYGAFRGGREPALPALTLQYADYAQWQRDWLQGEVLEKQAGFWRRQLEGARKILQLPADRPRPATPTLRGAYETVLLPDALTRSLHEFSTLEGVTPFMCGLAAFGALLSRYTGQTDVVVGSPSANRSQPGIENLIGLFSNTLPMRVDLSGRPSFRTLLGRVKEMALAAYAHEQMPIERLVEELNPARDLSHNPLFQVLFLQQRAFLTPLSVDGITLRPIILDRGGSLADVTLMLVERPEGIRAGLEYSTDLFDRSTIRRMLRHYETLLRRVLDDPERAVNALPLSTEREKRQVLAQWTRMDAGAPGDLAVPELFERQVTVSPDVPAVSCGERRWTYMELDARAEALARRLRALGVAPGARVAVCAERSPEMVAALLGVWKAGAAYVPLDPAYPTERLRWILEDSGAELLISLGSRKAELSPLVPRIVDLDDAASFEQEEAPEACLRAGGSDLAYVIYTSGSTGRPKGVSVLHRAVVNVLEAMRQRPGLLPSDRLLAVTTIAFDIAAVELFLPLVTGASVVIATRDIALDGRLLREELERSGATVMQATPHTWRMLVDADWRGPGVKMLCGGESLPRPLAAALLDRGGSLWNLYGPTETTIWSLAAEVLAGEGPVTLGRPLPNTDVHVLDRHGNSVPIGVPGELAIGGDGVARGYWNRPDLTAERFIPDPFSATAGARLYRTGDSVRLRDDGEMEFLGRLDEQTKIRGFRVEPGEIEAALRAHPGVKDAAVIAREDETGERRLVAYVTGRDGAPPDRGPLREFLGKSLSDVMIPSFFVPLEAMPRTTNGKLDRRALPAPQAAHADPEGSTALPRNSLELRLARLWSEILEVPAVGIRDNFFDLGGHSLLAVRLFSEIEKVLGPKLPLATLFQAPTVERLAGKLLEQGWQPPWSSLVVIQPGKGSRPPFICAAGLGGNVLEFHQLARHLGDDQPVYGLQAPGLDGGTDPLTHVEEMAAHYIAELRKVLPRGPYFLGGASFGGKVAYEIARQLESSGDSTALLALFDTNPPRRLETGTGVASWKRRARDAGERVRFHVGNVLARPERLSYIQARSKTLRRRIRSRIWQAMYRFYDGAEKALPPALRSVQEAAYLASRQYVPGPYGGWLTLFRTRVRSIASVDAARVWGQLAGRLRLVEISGDHTTMFREPHVAVLARELRAAIDAVIGALASGAPAVPGASGSAEPLPARPRAAAGPLTRPGNTLTSTR